MEQRVRLERDDDVAAIVVDNPPIHAGSAAVREGLIAAISTVQADASLQAAVLIGAANSSADRLCEAGRPGRKTGAGHDRYPEGALRPQPDPAVAALTAKARNDQGNAPRALGAAEIQRRVMLTLVNEAALLLAEGVAERAVLCDTGSIRGDVQHLPGERA